MHLSVFLAFVVGSYLFLMNLAMLVSQQRMKKVASDCLTDQGKSTCAGSLGILFGLVIVTSHNVWMYDWPVLITIIGWITLLQGVSRVFMPGQYAKAHKDFHSKIGYNLVTWVWLLAGLYLVWQGFENTDMMM
jgi:hypothetical protein